MSKQMATTNEILFRPRFLRSCEQNAPQERDYVSHEKEKGACSQRDGMTAYWNDQPVL